MTCEIYDGIKLFAAHNPIFSDRDRASVRSTINILTDMGLTSVEIETYLFTSTINHIGEKVMMVD